MRPGAVPLTSWMDRFSVSCAVGVEALAGLPTASSSTGSAPMALAPVHTGSVTSAAEPESWAT